MRREPTLQAPRNPASQRPRHPGPEEPKRPGTLPDPGIPKQGSTEASAQGRTDEGTQGGRDPGTRGTSIALLAGAPREGVHLVLPPCPALPAGLPSPLPTSSPQLSLGPTHPLDHLPLPAPDPGPWTLPAPDPGPAPDPVLTHCRSGDTSPGSVSPPRPWRPTRALLDVAVTHTHKRTTRLKRGVPGAGKPLCTRADGRRKAQAP